MILLLLLIPFSFSFSVLDTDAWRYKPFLPTHMPKTIVIIPAYPSVYHPFYTHVSLHTYTQQSVEEQFGLRVVSIVGLNSLLTFLESCAVEQESLEAIRKYRAEYGVVL